MRMETCLNSYKQRIVVYTSCAVLVASMATAYRMLGLQTESREYIEED